MTPKEILCAARQLADLTLRNPEFDSFCDTDKGGRTILSLQLSIVEWNKAWRVPYSTSNYLGLSAARIASALVLLELQQTGSRRLHSFEYPSAWASVTRKVEKLIAEVEAVTLTVPPDPCVDNKHNESLLRPHNGASKSSEQYTIQGTTSMNQLQAFCDQPFANTDLIYGFPVKDVTTERLMEYIRRIDSEIAALADLKAESKAVTKKVDELTAQKKKLIEVLDSREL